MKETMLKSVRTKTYMPCEKILLVKERRKKAERILLLSNFMIDFMTEEES